MGENSKYLPDDKLISLIADSYQFIQVLSRFGIPMGFGDKTVETVCKENNVDCDTFLSIVNYINNPYNGFRDEAHPPKIEAILQFLKSSHIYFLEFCLPSIRRKLIDGIKLRHSDVSFLILKLFDEYVDEVRSHMENEERELFPHIRKLINDDSHSHQTFSTYSDHHENVGTKLKELKKIIIKYTPNDAEANMLNAALYDIYRCEEELSSHCGIEDDILMPELKRLESAKGK